jgi:hypothetical protein
MAPIPFGETVKQITKLDIKADTPLVTIVSYTSVNNAGNATNGCARIKE